MERPELWVLTGCTAVGKTELSLRLAEKYSAEILSCDSRLVYRGMDIGTAKPRLEERARVPHHGLDLCSISEHYDVDRYQRYALQKIEDIQRRGHPILIVGGSGFYLQSFYRAVTDDVVVLPGIREEVDELFRRGGLAGLREALLRVSPQTGPLDLRNPRRVMRALARCLASGRSVPELQRNFEKKDSLFQSWKKRSCLLEREAENLQERAARRIDEMLAQGLVEEVRQLQRQGLSSDSPAGRAIGYRETLQWLESGCGDETLLKADILRHTGQLIHRQRSWFRHQIPLDRRLNLDRQNPDESFDILSSFFHWEAPCC
ncbi:MAG: tRNA (adenosine(37)-N6)-dimethylallyltransferase MiaA [Puniceicoccales bacterium]|jgi:tRNA dimethylallyltransferase|nr:tRNA (adenosine(37)-N6)-dimethylallyltransferase MiaA [Puniceicoccales bacterium]